MTGSKVLDVNLTRSLKVSNPTLKQVTLACPQSTGYPIHCRLAGTDTRRTTPEPVTGTLTVLGVYTGTHTYAYQILYGPARR